MNTLDKLSIIESDAAPKEGAIIETLSTSIKITHRCGCVYWSNILPLSHPEIEILLKKPMHGDDTTSNYAKSTGSATQI